MSEARRIKSRAGCSQCKRRRVKCDLTIPSCQQCCRQKLECPGYQKPLKWVGEAPTSLAPHASKNDHFVPINNEVRSTSASSSLPESLDDDAPALIHHYFTAVCKIAGCFDSHLNPFRIFPASMMIYSRPVYLLLQATSAAHLGRKGPRFRAKALSLQSEAFAAVRNDIGKLQEPTQNIVTDELMLTSIIAGLTSAWYDVNDVGQSHVLGGQVLLYLWLKPQTNRLQYQQTFILGSFVYWLMVSAFVVGDPMESFHYQEALQQTVESLDMSHDIVDDTDLPKTLRRIIPHPLTGFSTNLLMSVGKVGSLCRMAQSAEPKAGQYRTIGDNLQLEDISRLIEIELLDHIQVKQSNFKDPEDPETNIDEILSVGEAYRCAGLLQLYTKFPQLLQRHAINPPNTFETNFSLEMEAFRLNSAGHFTPPQHNWLRALAFHICQILDTIPPKSSTRVLQGLVVLVAAAWLVDPVSMAANEAGNDRFETLFNHPQLSLVNSPTPKEYWREKVRTGLLLHNETVDLPQVPRILNIVEEVWRLDDSGMEKCDWMVVVASKGLQTIYG